MGGVRRNEDEQRRAERVEVLQVILRALDARASLEEEIADSEDREEAAERVAAILRVGPAMAEVVLDLQWSALTRGTRQRIVDELAHLDGA